MRILLACLLFAHGIAFGQTFACQYVASAGLVWDKGQWELTRLAPGRPFFLTVDGVNLTPETVAKALETLPQNVQCERTFGTFTCRNGLARFLFFNPKESNGGVAEIRGAALPPSSRWNHPLKVEPFTCQQM